MDGQETLTDAEEPQRFRESQYALLNLLASLFQSSSSMQRAAVRTWDTVSALFGLLKNDDLREVALRMVRLLCL